MSITSALSNALSGLQANAREADLISNNLANALTPGYSRRTADLAAVVVDGRGAGVRVAGIELAQDPVTTASRRRTDAQLGNQSTLIDALKRIERQIGLPGEGTALAERAARFETALLAASNGPSSDDALRGVVRAGNDLVRSISALSTETQRVRMDADAEIATQVTRVNQNLRSIELLNREIRMRVIGGGDASALIDQRKALVDQVASVLPIRSVQRPDGEIALFTSNGATLVDGPAAQFGFVATPIITQAMTLSGGPLSGLTLNGRAVPIGEPTGGGPVDGGTLSALFRIRDTEMPAFADQLDALAADLATRFQDPAVDPTLGPGMPGLFTDGGGAYDPLNREGLAGRLALNAAVDPAAGGEYYRLRSGIGAAAPGDPGDNGILAALHDAATALRAPDPALGTPGADSFAGFAANLTAARVGEVARAEEEAAFLTALNGSLREAESSATGVDSDAELQRLLQVEKAYAANARVLSVVDDMIRRLLEI